MLALILLALEIRHFEGIARPDGYVVRLLLLVVRVPELHCVFLFFGPEEELRQGQGMRLIKE